MIDFKLSDEFVDSYKDKEVKWGYIDGAGNSLGEITTLRTYSRKKEDGTKEHWHEICRRVIEGMFTLQKKHCRANHIEWKNDKAQRTAKDAFDRMFNMKWLPPGRGMWAGGTSIVMEEGNSAPLQNCFSGSTEVITRNGVASLRDLEGMQTELLTKAGWVTGTVKSFGEQEIQRVTFAPFHAGPTKYRQVEEVTANHRWELEDGTLTTSLKVGDIVPGLVVNDHTPNEEAFRHGLTPEYSPGYKSLPVNPTPEYAHAFINGWITTDGTKDSRRDNDSIIIATQDSSAVEWLKRYAALGGFLIRGMSTSSVLETNYGKRQAPLQKVTLIPADHKWRVTSIENLEVAEEVFCAVVPEVERFTLASGIYTSNCAAYSTEDSIINAAEFLFDASMLGIGVGFDSNGANKFTIVKPTREGTYVIPDSREGWVESLRILLSAFIDEGQRITPLPTFDYSAVRPKGSAIKRFGGVASGPAPLKNLHDKVTAILESRVGDKVSMTTINDIMNIIGTCVIAGNVRRCLPEGTRVHLTNGIRNIEYVRVGDIVETSGKKARVTNVFDQGVQETVIVRYMGGELECTPNHQVAVFDTVDSWVFKRADELTTEDRIVWDREGITGVETDFPIYEAPERKSHDTTGQELDVPMLDSDSAWLIGMVHGDGYVFMPAGKTPNGSVSVASAPDTPGIPEAVARSLEEWGVRAHIRSGREGDAAIRISAHSTRLAEYFYDNVKRPNEPLEVPYWIKNAYPDIRIGYLAGLFDSDGSYKTRPLQALVTVYPEFANQVAELYASLGIQARATLARPAQGNNQALYAVNIVGGHNIRAFEATIAQHSLKYEGTRPFRSAGGATFSADMVRLTGLKAPDVYGKAPQNAERIENILGTYLPAIPYQVIEVVPSGRSVQTYDIEVEGIHQFTAEGIVVHNSAEISFIDADDPDVEAFTNLKNYELNPERAEHGYMANNSIRVKVGTDYSPFMDGVKLNGEPGFFWTDVVQKYGRLKDEPDYKDSKVTLSNPCCEQPLESGECCTLAEVFIGNCDNLDDFIKTLKVAYLYGKTVTLLPTKWEKTNTVMQRNRRIGLSVSGVADFVDTHGLPKLREQLDDGYNYVLKLDKSYSEWLCVRESIRHTTIKPAGSISLVAGSSPGTHWTPGGEYFIRRITFSTSDPIFLALKDAGYEWNTLKHDSNSAVVLFPIHSKSKRSASQVPAWEKLHLASEMQYWWSDNAVSCTVDFKQSEADDIPTLLGMYEGKLKGISFLPALEGGAYENMPYEEITAEKYNEMSRTIRKADFSASYGSGEEAKGENFCTSDHCEIEEEINSNAGDIIDIQEIKFA